MIEKIATLMRERGLTQGQIEAHCALSDDRISKWKNGQGEPTARQLLRIADMLNVPLRYLADDEMERPEPEVPEIQRRILWLAEQVGYDVAAKRLAMAPRDRQAPAAAREVPPAGDVIQSPPPPAKLRRLPERDPKTGHEIVPPDDGRKRRSS